MSDDDKIQVKHDRNAMVETMQSVDFPYDEIDGVEPEQDAFREAAHKSLDFIRKLIMAMQDYRGDKAFALDCACLALGFHDLCRSKTQTELAARHACHKANVAQCVKHIQFALSVEPMPGQHSKETRDKQSAKRKEQLK